MTPIRLRSTRVLGGLLLVLAACGGDGGGNDTWSPGTLATAHRSSPSNPMAAACGN